MSHAWRLRDEPYMTLNRHRRRADVAAPRQALPAKGDHEAFGSFYRQYEGAVVAYMRRRVGSPELAADLAMEVFAAALSAIHSERHAPDDAVSWLFGIAHHKLIDAHRTGRADDRARHRLGLEPITMEDAELQRIDALTDEGNVLRLLDALPAEQRDAIRARVLNERDYDDIAREAQASSTVIRQRVSRGLRHIKSQLKESP
jgi:RNA polymerase sigma-70 factor (ECF subfamily)